MDYNNEIVQREHEFTRSQQVKTAFISITVFVLALIVIALA